MGDNLDGGVGGDNAIATGQMDVDGRSVIDDPYAYKMSYPKKGLFVIINNRDFLPCTRMNTRSGTDLDAATLYQLFRISYGFDVQTHNNKTVNEMLDIVRRAGRADHSQAACFMCAILSHGDMGIVYGTDGIVKLDYLFEPFKGNNCPTLAGKPKIFIIQACRGTELDEGTEVADAGTEEHIHRIPNEADFLYAYSTTPGYYAWRNSSVGSWFVQSLAAVFARRQGDGEDDGRRDILSLLTRVNAKVALEYQSSAGRADMNRKKQMPSIVSMLTRLLYL